MDYMILKELINQRIEHEKENYKEACFDVGDDSPGALLSGGALGAYQQILKDIEDLEMKIIETSQL